jgi:uncharacterized protein (DUF1330 family)
MAPTLFVERVRRCGPTIDRFFRAAAFGAIIGLVWTSPATARGGGGHGMGGFGFHGGGRMGRGDRMMAPAYVLITVSSVSDADAFKKALQDMTTTVAGFTGRLAVDAEKPTAWEGAAPEHVVMIQFADAEQAQDWKNSDAFKSVDADPTRARLRPSSWFRVFRCREAAADVAAGASTPRRSSQTYRTTIACWTSG